MPTSKALRQWLESIPDLSQIVVDPVGDWKEPTKRAETSVRADPGPLAAGLADRLKAGASSRDRAWTDSWTSADREVEGSVEMEFDTAELSDNNEPDVWFELAANLRDGDQVLAASSMPVRDQETFLPPGRERVRFLANRGANGIDGLVSTAAGVAADGAGPGRCWATSRSCTTSAALPWRREPELAAGGAGQRRRRHLPLPPAGRRGPRPTSSRRCWARPRVSICGAPRSCSGLDVAVAQNPHEVEQALAGDERVVIVPLDRARNVEVHRRLSEAAAAALAPA